jgi:hypothetical protein
MVVNGLRLPAAFVQAVQEGKTSRVWRLKSGQDACGNRLWTSVGTIYSDEDTMANETAAVAGVRMNDRETIEWLATEEDPYASDPGFVAYITDFSKILCFGHAGDGSPFCFDFRDDSERPSVLYWDDVYWRRIAPDFESFLGLFWEELQP